MKYVWTSNDTTLTAFGIAVILVHQGLFKGLRRLKVLGIDIKVTVLVFKNSVLR